MDTSVLLNWIFGGGLLAALTALVTLGPTVRKAKAEAEKAKADAETVRIDNTEHATRILIENIVEPLKKELSATRREMARLRKAIDGANDCLHRADSVSYTHLPGRARIPTCFRYFPHPPAPSAVPRRHPWDMCIPG